LTSGEMMERRFGINGMWTFGGKPWPREAVALVAALARSDPDEYNREKAAELLEDHGYPGRASTP
jgi:ABC-type transport system substrate-binding protein